MRNFDGKVEVENLFNFFGNQVFGESSYRDVVSPHKEFSQRQDFVLSVSQPANP